MKTQKGFTLIELMIVVVVIGILSIVGLPAYSNYVIRGKIPEATSNLATMRGQMEQYFQDNRFYTTTAATTVCGVAFNNSTYFNYTCTGTASTFTITATGTGTMTGFTYTIDQSNTKTSTITASGWAATSTSCWITKQGGVC